VISDIHLGNNLNSAEEIVANLKKYFVKYNKLIKQVQIIFLAGDIYDKLLVNGSRPFIVSLEWLTWLAMYCKEHNIKLRALEGTPSHDWRQAKVLNTALTELKIEVDFKYIDTLAIEYMAEYDINILYIPDEYKHNASETFEEVQELMKTHGLSQVDLIIMHGQFHYQLPMIVLESSHNEEDYISICKHYICIGHIHTHSVNGKILAQGSFDRISHNEEEPKGALLISIKEHADDSFMFLVNENAKEFITYDYQDVDIETIRNKLDVDVKKHKPGSQLRLWVNPESKLIKHKNEINSWYPELTVRLDVKKDKKTYEQKDRVISFNQLDSFHITKDNIGDLINVEIAKHDLDITSMKLLGSELEKCI
jgi:hypothetical protein